MSLQETTVRLLEQAESRFYGKYRGTVSDNADPLHRGRIRATVPEVLGDVETGWCTPCVPYAGKDKGWFAVPETGDGVWIEFEAGDPSRPIWTGSWWGDDEIPSDPDGSQGTTQTKLFKSANGLIVDLDDSAQEIKVSDNRGSNLVNIKVNEGKIVIQATANVTLEAALIQHGQNASHPAVFGDQLLTYLNQLVTMFNTHLHPGELAAGFIPVTPAPPVPPFPPATPSLLSMKVEVE